MGLNEDEDNVTRRTRRFKRSQYSATSEENPSILQVLCFYLYTHTDASRTENTAPLRFTLLLAFYYCSPLHKYCPRRLNCARTWKRRLICFLSVLRLSQSYLSQ